VFIVTAAAISALGTGCALFLQCLDRLSLPPSEGGKRISALAESNNKMAMVYVDGSRVPVDSQPKLFGLVCGLAAIWR